MKTLPLVVFLSCAMLVPAFAQTSSDTKEANSERTLLGGSARDGFTLRGAEVVMTRSGVTTKVDHDIALPNGLRVKANGSVVLRDGSTTALRPNQLLTFDGNFQDVLLTPEGVAPLSSVDPGPAPKADAGPSVRDCVFLSGTEVFITRNGITEKVTSDVRLANGTTVKSSGMVALPNGNSITLRSTQFLDLSGVVHDLPTRSTIRPARR
jgi:hypothetical protein